MYLMHGPSGDLVEVLSREALFDPFQKAVNGRFHTGEALQEPAAFAQGELVFASSEYQPRCWLYPAYKTEPRRRPGLHRPWPRSMRSAG